VTAIVALETNDSAVQVMGDETLRTVARELVRLDQLDYRLDGEGEHQDSAARDGEAITAQDAAMTQKASTEWNSCVAQLTKAEVEFKAVTGQTE
jgi:hypothetical protein